MQYKWFERRAFVYSNQESLDKAINYFGSGSAFLLKNFNLQDVLFFDKIIYVHYSFGSGGSVFEDKSELKSLIRSAPESNIRFFLII